MKSSYAKTGISVIAILGLLTGLPAFADKKDDTRVYRWKDDSGSNHYGDYVPPEYADSGHTVLNQHGVEVERVSGALTEEERAKQAEMARIEKQTFVLQHITSFCIGASIALGFVLIHMNYFA